ncbi:MAG: hypothetical protein ACKPKO_39375, partial [Candidatus Fonsibacter sp.]
NAAWSAAARGRTFCLSERRPLRTCSSHAKCRFHRHIMFGATIIITFGGMLLDRSARRFAPAIE